MEIADISAERNKHILSTLEWVRGIMNYTQELIDDGEFYENHQEISTTNGNKMINSIKSFMEYDLPNYDGPNATEATLMCGEIISTIEEILDIGRKYLDNIPKKYLN